jgi:thymidylate synthase
MNQDEQNYLNLMKHILENGVDKKDRTGVGTKSIFGTQLRFSLEDNTLPLLTTKRVFIRGAIEELLFFIRGETDTKLLEAKNVNIWKGNTSREFLDKRGLNHYDVGEMGPMYGYQWRKFGADSSKNYSGVDQLANAIDLIKKDPDSRRIMITAYNPVDDNKTVLAPCHNFFQFYVNNGELSCMWTQRSVDYSIGFGFNLASYALLTHIIAKLTNLKAKELIFSGGDTHLYNNTIDGIKLQLQRNPYTFPKLKINKELNSLTDIEELKFEDFEILNYQHHPAIKMEMAI